MTQLGIEAAAIGGRWPGVFDALAELRRLPFLDADWLARCPVFEPVETTHVCGRRSTRRGAAARRSGRAKAQ